MNAPGAVMTDDQDDPSNEKPVQRRTDNLVLLITETPQFLKGAQRTIDQSEAVLQRVARERGEL